MVPNLAMRGEKIYEYEFVTTGVTDYALAWMLFSPERKRFHFKVPDSS
jgi:hypothetical protein